MIQSKSVSNDISTAHKDEGVIRLETEVSKSRPVERKWYKSSCIKPSFVIFDIRAAGLSVRVPGCQKLQMMA